MFLVNSRLDLVIATSSRRYLFFQSYEVILPSSLERVISRPLVYSTYLPVSVSGTGKSLSVGRSSFSREYDITCDLSVDKLLPSSAQDIFSSTSQHLTS